MVKDFGRRLENLREKSGYTKREISHILGYTPNVYGAYEREDRRPTMETMVKLADIFNVSLDYLIRGEEYQQKSEEYSDIEQLKKVLNYFKNKGIDKPYFLQFEKWTVLNNEDIRELSNHFEWVVYKTRNNL